MAAKQEEPAAAIVIIRKECQYDLLNKISSQSSPFGETFRCRERDSGTEYCMRIVPLEALSGRSTSVYTKEKLELWKSLRHSHILPFLSHWQDSHNLYILTQSALCCLEDLLHSKGKPPPQALFEQWLYQIAAALQYLHHEYDPHRPVVHRNLKPTSVMVTDHYTLRLSDFGVSRELEGPDAIARTFIGTAGIMSPEMIREKSYTAKTDIWSFGITAVYIATLRKAVEAQTFQGLFEKIVSGQVVYLSGEYSPDTSRIVNRMLEVKPHSRPSSQDLVQDIVKTFPSCQRAPDQDSYPDADSGHSGAGASVAEYERCDIPSTRSSRVTKRSASCPEVTPHDGSMYSSTAAASSCREASAPGESGASGPRQAAVNLSSLSLVILTKAMDAETTNTDRESVDQPRAHTGGSGKASKEVREEHSNAQKGGNKMLCTFPGAYNVTRNLATCARNSTTAPSTRSRTVSESSAVDSAQLNTQLQADSIEEWSPQLQQFWNIASSLLSRMTLHQLLDALMIMKLVSDEELQMWLQHNVGDGTENSFDDLRQFYLLNKDLSGNDVMSVIQTFRQSQGPH